MTSKYTLYPSSRKELDLRQEMSNLLNGASDEIAKGQKALLRKMNRDSSGNLVRCDCVDSLTEEADQDYYCRGCWGHRYFWTENEIVYYRNDDSFRKYLGKNQEFEGDNFYLQYDETITTDDFIVLVNLDADGNITVPVTRGTVFEILAADPFRADNGRIEFWRIRPKETREWSVWYGVQPRNF